MLEHRDGEKWLAIEVAKELRGTVKNWHRRVEVKCAKCRSNCTELSPRLHQERPLNEPPNLRNAPSTGVAVNEFPSIMLNA